MQQINLLIDELKPRTDPLQAKHALALAGAFIALLLGISVFDAFELADVREQRTTLASQLELLNIGNEKLTATVDAASADALADSVATLRSEVGTNRALVQALASANSLGRAGFSGYLEDLAERPQPGLWLTTFSLSDGGEQIRLEGVTQAPANVPRFLRRLSDSEHFAGHRFDHFELSSGESGLLEFSIIGPAEAEPQ